jgi:predicted nucleotidyltransferase
VQLTGSIGRVGAFARYSDAVVIEEAVQRLAPIAARHEEVVLRLVSGSRARGDHHTGSDWDLGYVSRGEVDHLALLDEVAHALGTDSVDLADLDRASGLLRFRAAREGVVVYQAEQGAFESFAVEAALHWYDVEPTVRREHAAILAGLG